VHHGKHKDVVEVVKAVEEAVGLVKAVEELKEPFSSKFTTVDWMTKSSSQKPATDSHQWIEVHCSGSSAADDGLLSLPQPDFSESAQWSYYGPLSAADGKRPPEQACSLLKQ
jgi:hypothetical protein